MYRRMIIFPLLVGGILLAGFASTGDDVDEKALVDRVKASINERMYDTCQDITIVREADALYRGHAEFVNGVRVNLEVTINKGAISYRFLERPQPDAGALRARVEALEQLIDQLEAEVSRLTDLCDQAGIDTDAVGPQFVPGNIQEPNENSIEPEQDMATPEYPGPVADAESTPVFTQKLYDRIEKNMSYLEVMGILNDEGQTISGSYFDGAENAVVIWANEDDSHICVVFRDGVVLVKTQSDLPEAVTPPTY